MHAIDAAVVLALLMGAGPAEAPERPPDELIDLLQNVELLDDYGDLLDVETDDEPAPQAAPGDPAKPFDAPGVPIGRDAGP